MTLILAYTLNSLWQIPFITLAATIIAALAARASTRNPASVRHRIWVSALLLEIVLPACTLPAYAAASSLQTFLSFFNVRRGPAYVTVASTTLAPVPITHVKLPPLLLAVLCAAYLLTILYFLARLLHGLFKTHTILTSATDLTVRPHPHNLDRVRIATSPSLPGPVTLGILHPVLLLPPDFLSEIPPEDQQALFAHEAAHIRRNDFALNLLYTVLSIPIAYHPFVRFTHRRLAETREMVCDTFAARSLAGPEPYTRSLLRMAETLAAPHPASPLHAIGFLDANSFERRVMNLTETPLILSRTRRILLACTCVILALITTASALALHLEAPTSPPAGQTKVSGGVMAGQIAYKVPPVYPAEAKANHDTLDGTVILHAIIGKDGTIQNLTVKQSLRRDYDISALEAVRQWRYEPFLINGEPTEVETDITINYSIDPSSNQK